MRFLALVSLGLALTLPGFAAVAPASDPDDAAQTWAEAFNRRDLDSIVTLYAPDAVLWGTTSPILRDTPEKIRDYFSNMPQRPNVRVALGEHRLRVLGDVAIDTGYYTFSNTDNGQKTSTAARFSFVFRRENGRWLIVDHHSSAAPPPRK